MQFFKLMKGNAFDFFIISRSVFTTLRSIIHSPHFHPSHSSLYTMASTQNTAPYFLFDIVIKDQLVKLFSFLLYLYFVIFLETHCFLELQGIEPISLSNSSQTHSLCVLFTLKASTLLFPQAPSLPSLGTSWVIPPASLRLTTICC